MKGRGGRGPVKGAPERLAVQGHHALTALGEAAHEGHKTRLELGRIEQPKHAREGVMAWDAVPEREDLFEEGVLGAPEPDHVGAGLAPAQHGAQANEQDLQKLVALGIARARILQIRENRRKLLHGTTFDPKWCHRVEPVRLNPQANFLKCDSPVIRGERASLFLIIFVTLADATGGPSTILIRPSNDRDAAARAPACRDEPPLARCGAPWMRSRPRAQGRTSP